MKLPDLVHLPVNLHKLELLSLARQAVLEMNLVVARRFKTVRTVNRAQAVLVDQPTTQSQSRRQPS